MDVAQALASLNDRIAKALLLDVHVISVQVEDHVIGADRLDQRECLGGSVVQIGLVAVDRLDAEGDTTLGSISRYLAQHIDTGLALGRRRRLASQRAQVGVEYAGKAARAKGFDLVKRQPQEIQRLLRVGG